MTYENEQTKDVLDSYRKRIQAYWKKTIEDKYTLSAEELSDMVAMKKDLLSRNGTGDSELIDRLKRVTYFNGVLERGKREEKLNAEYAALSQRYHEPGLSKEEETRIAKRLNDISFIISDH